MEASGRRSSKNRRQTIRIIDDDDDGNNDDVIDDDEVGDNADIPFCDAGLLREKAKGKMSIYKHRASQRQSE